MCKSKFKGFQPGMPPNRSVEKMGGSLMGATPTRSMRCRESQYQNVGKMSIIQHNMENPKVEN